MDKKIEQIINYAVAAPSGDNSQPWRFMLKGSILEIYNLPDRDNPYLNYKQSGSFIAHGALLRNIEIASTRFQLSCQISFFPNNSKKNLVAQVMFTQSKNQDVSPLFDAIKKRETNRRFYENKNLLIEHLGILNETSISNNVLLRFTVDETERQYLGKAGSIAEVVILENKFLHECLFKDVVWSEQQEKRERHGLYIKTMEFNFIQKFLFWLASNSTLMDFAKMIRFPYFIASQDAILYASGSAMGILSLKKESPENFVQLGMSMQDIWLKATLAGLAFQPITATLFLGYILKNIPTDETISEAHKLLSLKAYDKIISIFKIGKDELPLIMFRIGYAPKASARSSRIAPILETDL